jgi:hypothetical protein
VAAEQFAARVSGATEGVTRSGEQTVFAGSAARDSAPVTTQAAGRPSEEAASPAARSGTGDVWSGFAARPSASLSTAGAAAAPQSGGLGSQAIGMAAVGLGLAGLAGGFVVAAVRRQRVHAGRSSGRNES